jgi:hypothetical protein
MKNFFVILMMITIGLGCSEDDICVEKLKDGCVCTTQYDPVCGCNNKTYGNACEAACAGIEVSYTGECKK